MGAFYNYRAGEVIFRENESGETAYIINHGRVEISKESAGQKVTLAYMGPGGVFGEMSMIADKPRSATVTAVEETAVYEIDSEGFSQTFQTNPEIALDFLKVVFERLREANATILRLQKSSSEPLLAPITPVPEAAAEAEAAVYLEGLTPEAAQALPASPLRIEKFPFRIGRETQDPLTYNDLSIPDIKPGQISRHHVALIEHKGRIAVADRGSRLGSWLDDQKVGGSTGEPLLWSSGSEATLVLGDKDSPFRYRVIVEEEGASFEDPLDFSSGRI